MKRGILLAVVFAVAVGACGADGDPGSDPTSEPIPGSAMGPGISVEDAIALGSEQPVLVNGFLFIDTEGNITLASLMAESLPPIPGGEQLSVEGLNLDTYEFSESQGLRWTDQLVQVLGVLDGDALVVSPTLSG